MAIRINVGRAIEHADEFAEWLAGYGYHVTQDESATGISINGASEFADKSVQHCSDVLHSRFSELMED